MSVFGLKEDKTMNTVEINRRFNAMYNHMSGIYREVIKKYSMSECQFWILYALSSEGRPLNQKELQSYLIAPKQTIHSAIHRMLDEGYILLKETSGKRKFFELTEKGTQLASVSVSKVLEMEFTVLNEFTPEERNTLLSLSEKYIRLFEKEAL